MDIIDSDAAAKAPGISRQQLHNVIGDRYGITPEMVVRLEKALGSTVDTWPRMQMNYDLAQIRVRASAMKVKRLTAALRVTVVWRQGWKPARAETSCDSVHQRRTEMKFA
jgi:addiction module HigA family antidote